MLVNGNIIELKPTDSRKSFYGKARVVMAENGDKTLISYTTPVLKLSADGKLEKLWHGYSATTMRHINSFCDTFGINGGGKRWWENL